MSTKATSVFKHLAETLSTIHHQYVVVPADKATLLLSAKIITLIAKRYNSAETAHKVILHIQQLYYQKRGSH